VGFIRAAVSAVETDLVLVHIKIEFTTNTDMVEYMHERNQQQIYGVIDRVGAYVLERGEERRGSGGGIRKTAK